MDLKKAVLKDGVYCWDAEIDEAYKAYEFRQSLWKGILVILLSSPLGYLHALLFDETFSVLALIIMFPLGALIILIVALCFLHSKRSRSMSLSMTEKDILITVGASNTRIFFRDVHRVEPDPGNRRIVLVTGFSRPVICVPAEDYEPLRDFILHSVEANGSKQYD